MTVGWWSRDSKTIFFNDGWRATTQLFALDVTSGKARPITNVKAALSVSEDADTRRLLLNYSDPTTPPTIFTVASIDDVASREKWIALTHCNPWIREQVALGKSLKSPGNRKTERQWAAYWSNPSATSPARGIR